MSSQNNYAPFDYKRFCGASTRKPHLREPHCLPLRYIFNTLSHPRTLVEFHYFNSFPPFYFLKLGTKYILSYEYNKTSSSYIPN